MRNIIAGPFWGEFGWELMRWQGIFRKIKQDKPNIKIVMVSRPGHEILYQDYINDYIGIEGPPNGETDGWRVNGQVPRLGKTLLEKYSDYMYMDPLCVMRSYKQSFIKYKPSHPNISSYDILIHARDTKKVGTEYRNWSHENYSNLVKELEKDGDLNIGFIGTQKGAWANMELGDDLRGIPLDKLVDIIGHCKLVIGPSSGPMHLASLCGTPHLVWTDNKHWSSCGGTNRRRYEELWNPLDTKVKVLDEDNWQPSVEKVVENIRELI